MGTRAAVGLTLFTIGHSTRSSADFLALLQEFGIARLVDVRRYPVSRRHPQFTRATLERVLGDQGIAYEHAPDLGGHRDPRPDSVNVYWRIDAFRGYADHTATAAFRQALGRLLAAAEREVTAVMCAEARPERCHRQLIADAVVLRGGVVHHIVAPGQMEDHSPPAEAVLEGEAVTYRRRKQRALFD